MKVLTTAMSLSLALAATAQTQTLLVDQAGQPNFIWNAANTNSATFFDLVVSNPAGVTLRALEIQSFSPAGTPATIQLWINRTQTTYDTFQILPAAPLETGDPSGWELVSDGLYESNGLQAYGTTCQSAYTVNVPDTFLPAGTYPMGIIYDGVRCVFEGLTTYPPAPGTYATADIEVTGGYAQAVAWTSGTLALPTVAQGINVNGAVNLFGITYDPGNVPHACSEQASFGEGSIKNSASFYDFFQGAAASSLALTGTSMDLVNTGVGYVVSRGTTAFRPNSGNETALVPVDDGEEEIVIPFLPLPYPTDIGPATTTSIWVHSNGYISAAMQSPLAYAPLDQQEILQADQLVWFGNYHDYNPAEVGSGSIIWEVDLLASPNPTLYVTWDNVESWPDTVANPSRVQYQFDLVSGNISVVYDLLDGTGGGTFAGQDDFQIGFSPAGPSPDTAEFDITTTAGFVVTLPETFPLTLELGGAPLVGAQVDFTTSNVVGTSVGMNLLSTSLAPGTPISLGFLGAPVETVAWIDPATAIINGIDNGNLTLGLPIPNIPALAGAEVFSQSIWFDFSSIINGTVFPGLLSSNGVRFVIGNF
jgi:hypothetical protein